MSIANLKTSRGCIKLLFNVPTEITSCLIILFAELRQITMNFSFTSSLKRGIKISATSSGEVILESEIYLFCEFTRLLISNAAANAADLSLPIPSIFLRALGDCAASVDRLPYLVIKSCPTSITDFPFMPILSKIARSSASLRL